MPRRNDPAVGATPGIDYCENLSLDLSYTDNPPPTITAAGVIVLKQITVEDASGKLEVKPAPFEVCATLCFVPLEDLIGNYTL
jgi:hypothetical protein